MRLLAHYSGDEMLVETFMNDEDSHGATAVNMFKLPCDASNAKKLYAHLRQVAKTINFMLMYGGGASTLFNQLESEDAIDENGNLITKNKAKEYYALYFETYAGVRDFINNQKLFAHKHKKVYTVLGRIRHLDGIDSNDKKISSFWERTSINSPIQGSAGDVMIKVQPKIERSKRLKQLGATLRLQVHDELVFNGKRKNKDEIIKEAKRIMEHPFDTPLRVPLRVDADFGDSYADAK